MILEHSEIADLSNQEKDDAPSNFHVYFELVPGGTSRRLRAGCCASGSDRIGQ
jgi:hypothetical protein